MLSSFQLVTAEKAENRKDYSFFFTIRVVVYYCFVEDVILRMRGTHESHEN